MKTFCSNCSQEVEVPDNAAGTSVPCPACGTAFTPEEPKTCRHCGALNPRSVTKCTACGKSLISIGIRKPGAAPAPAASAEPEKAEESRADRPRIGIRKPGAVPVPAAPAEPEKTEEPQPVRPKIAIRKPGAAASAPAPVPTPAPAAAPAAGGPPKLDLAIPKKPGAAPAAGGPPKLDLSIPKKPGAAPAAGGPPKLDLAIPKKPGVAPAAGGPPKLSLTPAAAPAVPGKKPEAPAAEKEEKKPKEKVPLSDEAKKKIRIAVSIVIGLLVLGIAGAVVYFILSDPTDPQKQLDEAIKSMESGKTERAVRLLEKSAKQGNCHASALLGDMYLKGEGVTEDLSRAVELFRSAGDDPLAHFRLGQLHSEGKGVEKDLRKAVKHFEAAVRGGHAEAELEYAKCFAEGLGVKKDERKGLPWRKKLADEGDPEAQLDMARYHLNGVFTQYDAAEAVRYLTLAAKQGNRTARYRLAELTLKGIGTKKNEADATAEFEKLYREITGMPSDQKPSDADLIIAAKCLIRGYGVKTPDPAQAETLLAGPAGRKVPEAVMLLYYLTKDDAKKKSLLKKALSLNIPEAKEITALQIAGADPKKADRLLKEAQAQGSLSAFAVAAMIHLKKEPAQAFKESKYAWERQDPLGSLIYAECLETGVGGAKKNPEKALEIYWRLASSDTPVQAQAHAKLAGLFKKKEFREELKKRFQDRLKNGTPEEKQAILKMQANLYLLGAGFPKSTSKAVDCLWEAKAVDELIQLLKKGIETKKIISLFLKNEKDISDPELLYTLADLLISGKEGIRARPVKGAEFLKKAAAAGHPRAAYEMGRLCAQDVSFDLMTPDELRPETKVERSPDEAIAFFRQAAEAGLPDAQYRYARAILMAKELPEGVKNQNAEAKVWLEKAARGKYAPAMFLYAMVCLDSGNVAKSERTGLLQNIRSAAEAGYPLAMFAMGDIAAAAGKNEDADSWYEKAAEVKFVPALIQLKRKKKNSALIREAAAAGYLPAQAEEALSLLKKERKEKSGKRSEARRKLERLVERGYSVCLNELGVATYDEDKKKALKFFKKAAANGSACALFNIGVYTFREENLGGGDYQSVKEIFAKLRTEHPDFTRHPEGLEEDLDRLSELETQFRKLNEKRKAIRRQLRQNSSPEVKADAEQCERDLENMRGELDTVTASLKKKLDWILEPNYSAFFRKAPPKIRYPWVPAADLTPLKTAYK